MEALKDKLILITGATSGIGKEIAILLLKNRANLILVGRNEKALKEFQKRFSQYGRIAYYLSDLNDLDQVYILLDRLKKVHKKPDILIHSAGIFHGARIEETTDDQLNQSLTVNYLAPFIITRELMGSITSKKGAVLFINSTVALFPKADVSAYAASKAALKSFADILYEEVSSKGVRVASVYPGRVATPMQETLCKKDGTAYEPDYFISPETIAESVLQILTLPRNAEIKDLTIRQPRRIQ